MHVREKYHVLNALYKERMVEAQRKALESAKVVMEKGHCPMLEKNGNEYAMRRDANGNIMYYEFSKEKTIIPEFYLSYINIDQTRFNTYDDRGYDDTHSDNFRFHNFSIGIKAYFYEV